MCINFSSVLLFAVLTFYRHQYSVRLFKDADMTLPVSESAQDLIS